MIRRLTLGWLPIALAVPLFAQSETEPPPPRPPLVAVLPKMMQVTLLLDAEKTAPLAEQGSPVLAAGEVAWKSVEVVKTEDIRLVKATMTDGNCRDTWVLGGKLFDKTFDGKQISCSDYHPALPAFFETSNTAFYGTDWISLENYKGIEVFNGKKCYVYEAVDADLSGKWEPVGVPHHGISPAQTALKAWIDVETRLPVAVTLREGLVRYRFEKPPESLLVPPPEYVQYLLRMKKAAERRQKEAALR